MDEPNRGGRPRKIQDPEAAHKAELLAFIDLSRRVRKLLEKQITYLEKQFENTDGITMSVEGMLEVMAGLGTLLTTSNRVVEQGLKALDRGSRVPTDSEDPEEVMASLTGGRG